MKKQMICPVSGGPMRPVFEETILRKYRVQYYYCSDCGFLGTEHPYWLADAYSEAISEADIGLVQRNIANSIIAKILLKKCLGKTSGQYLDVAGGYGLLTRLLRDKGVDCYTTDKYCKNIFAKGFEPTTDFRADALFAFEVLEHVDSPLTFIREMFDTYKCKTLIFSTKTYSKSIPDPDWWYYAFDTGQHISFYQERTLSTLAVKLGCKYYKISPDLHMITDVKIRKTAVMLCSNKLYIKALTVLGVLRRSRSAPLSRVGKDSSQGL